MLSDVTVQFGLAREDSIIAPRRFAREESTAQS